MRRSAVEQRYKIQRGLILTSPEGKIQFIDRNARRLLKKLSGSRGRTSHLPAELRQWLLTTERKRFARSIGDQGQRGRLCFTRRSRADRSVVVELELVTGKAIKESSRRQHGLTTREREVLLWLARGKTNADIAAILNIAPATVGKHLERIYSKLGVENRTAAANYVRSDE